MKKETRIFAVIDTNVLVSSFFSADGMSPPAIVVNSVINGLVKPLYNEEIIQEYRDVLSRDKFNFGKEQIEDLIQAFVYFGINSGRMECIGEFFPDKDDVVFYEVKMSCDSAFLVTGNIKHFPADPLVVTPSQMVDILKNRNLI